MLQDRLLRERLAELHALSSFHCDHRLASSMQSVFEDFAVPTLLRISEHTEYNMIMPILSGTSILHNWVS